MKTMKVLAAAAAIALPLQFAQAQDNSFNAQVVFPDVSGFSGGMGVALGYEAGLDSNLSVEGEFTTTLSSPDHRYPWGETLDVSYYTLGAYMKYTVDVSPEVGLYGRVGLLYESVEVSSDWGGSASDNDFGFTLGVGADYALSQQLDLTAGFTIIESDINHFTAGIKYKL